jgi:transposase/predicted nucleic acid-binding protein
MALACVLDASAAVRLILADPAAAELAERVGGAALVLAPELMLSELANTLWKLQRADRLNDLDPQELLAEALALACHLNHPVYDCLYLALARREAASCQATAKTGPEATRKLVHPVERITKESKCLAGASSLEPMALELAVQTPQDVEAMRRLAAAGWGRRRIAKELGCSPETVRKYLRQGGWQPYGKPCRNSVLDGHGEWLRQRFLAHRGNADVVRQELEREKGLKVSLRTVERAVEPWRLEVRNAALATVRFETPPGRQLQADFGQCVVRIGGERERVHLAVLTLGYSRRLLVRAFRSEKQEHWLAALEEGFRHWGGVPQEVLMDNARALVSQHDPERQILVFAQRLEEFARYWDFKPRACRPYRARTKGKDERGVAYVKQNAIAGREFDSWAELEAHLVRWTREVADLRIHGTTGEAPLERFLREEAQVLQPLEDKPSFLAEQELVRIVHSDCCVEVEANWYSAPQALIRQRVSVLVRDQQVLIRHGGRIVAEHGRLRPGSRSRQVIDGHWEGLVPQRQRQEAVASLESLMAAAEQRSRPVRSSELARPLSVYAEVAGEVAA